MKQTRQTIETRQAKILSLIRERREIRVEELVRIFNVSPMTVRRDLQTLESQGFVSRFYGGAAVDQRPSDTVVGGNPINLYRELIARYAASLVSDGDRLFVNGSSTALSSLRYIRKTDVCVFTNNGQAVNQRFPEGISVTLSGGEVKSPSGILTGDCAMRNLLMVNADKAFLGCTGISPNGEVLCGIPTELGINETMVSHAEEYYILADHTKIGKTSTYASCSLERRGTVITDEQAPAAMVEQLRAIGMKVIQVSKNDFHTDEGLV